MPWTRGGVVVVDEGKSAGRVYYRKWDYRVDTLAYQVRWRVREPDDVYCVAERRDDRIRM